MEGMPEPAYEGATLGEYRGNRTRLPRFAPRLRFRMWLLHKPPAGSLEPFYGWGRKSRKSFGRDAPCPASGLPAPPAVVTTSGAQVFADGFVQQPRMTASVRARAALTLAQDDEQAPGPPPRSRLLRHGEAEVCRVDPDTPGPRPKRPWVCELRRASFCHDSSMVGPGALLRQRCRSCGLAT
jgi:hypothetical protein